MFDKHSAAVERAMKRKAYSAFRFIVPRSQFRAIALKELVVDLV
jgi:hypothetical protein